MNGKRVSGVLVVTIAMLIANVDYNSEIQPVFNDNCSSCHVSGSSGGLSLGSYSDLMSTGNHAPVVVAGDHVNSVLYQKISGNQTFGSSMPPYGDLSEDQVNLIASWIDEGATENAATPTSTVFITELTDPQNSSDAGRYVELYNNGSSEVNLDEGWALQRWTNGNADPQSPVSLTGTIAAGGFFIVCNDANKFNTIYGLTCDQDIGTGGAADSNGDDNIALLDVTGAIVDMFGIAGEDGSGTGHEFEDGRAERAAGVTSGNVVWNEGEWNIDNDSGGGDGNQYAPEGFDPDEWIGAGEVAFCEDEGACNYGEAGDCAYVNVGWGNLQWPFSTSVVAGTASENIYGQVYVAGVTGSANPESGISAELGYGTSSSSPDDSWTWAGTTINGSSGDNDEFSGQLTIDDPGTYSFSYRYSYESSCWYYAVETGTIDVLAPETAAVTFNVDMSYQDVSDDGVVVYGLFSWSEGFAMTDDGATGIYSTTVDLPAGDYLYKFKNGNSWENVDELECAVFDDPDGDGFGYWDRSVTVADSDQALDTDCFGACGACLGGCMDPNATNYNPNANVDDGSCDYLAVDPDDIFFSEYGEGSSYNKYLEIYNATDAEVDLSGYQRVSCTNGCTEWEYYSVFAEGAMIAADDVYVLCDSGVGEDFPGAECDEIGALYFNGDDAQGIYHTASATTIDVIGAIGDDPGSGWEVAGVSNGTKDHSLVRQASVTTGNADWTSAAGTNADDSEWLVFDQNTWAYIGSHPHDFAALCDDESACNFGDEGDCEYASEGSDCDGNVLINVTFQVNMAEQIVDTEGYGLDLFLDNPYGYHDMFDEDGDGVWSIALTLVANTEYAYKFKNGDEWEVDFNDLDCGAGDTYGNRIFTTGDSDMTLDTVCFNSCTDCEEEVVCGTGDVNFDDLLNVTDIVNIVNHVLLISTMDEDAVCAADMDGNELLNVVDIVVIVNIILDGRLVYAAEAKLMKTESGLYLDSDGQVGAVQITIHHDELFSFELSDHSLVSKAVTRGNTTTLISVLPENGLIISTQYDYEIIDVIAANNQGEISVHIVNGFQLLSNYPNPFNPATIINYFVDVDSRITLKVFDINGRIVNSLVNEFLTSGNYTTSWHGIDDYGNQVGSGLYILVYESDAGIKTQKITLLR